MNIVRTSRQEVYGLTPEQREKVKESLTYDNPAYKNAKRYGRSKYISIPPYLTYYDEYSVRVAEGERSKVLTCPIGVNLCEILKVPVIPIEDKRCDVQVKYPKFLLDLRNDQIRAEKAYMQEVNYAVHPKNIIQLPTGKGKSILALHIAQKLKQRTLILVHKDDLVVGWQKDIKLCFGEEIEIGLIKAKSRRVGRQITIATVQTLSRMSEEELSSYINQFGLVVQDECHHVGLNIFNIIDKFNSKYKLGLSATPKRSDGLNFVFDLYFGGLCYKHIITDDDEDICSVEVEVLKSPYKFRPFVHEGQVFNYYDFDPKELPDNIEFLDQMDYKERPTVPFLAIDDGAVSSRQTKILVCKKIMEEYRAGHSIIALFTQKEHINSYYRHLCRYIPKDQIMLYYGDSKEKSEDMMTKAENKEVLVTLATYAKATEGTNVKSWEVEFLVSSSNNSKNVEQATGRIRRRKEGKLNPVKVYDINYADCYSLSGHLSTRLSTYRRLKYTVTGIKEKKSRGMFSRGYRN